MSTINWPPEIDTAIASPCREDVLSIKEGQQRIKEAIKKAQGYLLSLRSHFMEKGGGS
jgi:hypothetical protein